MDDEKNKFDRARRLLSRVMQRLVTQAFLQWRMHCRFERTMKELSSVVDPVADVLDKLPENRTPTDVQRLMPLVSQIEAYRPLHQPVRELLASYLQLAVVSDRVELPRVPADNACLFSVVYGSITALMGDPADQAMSAIKNFAVEQLGGDATAEASQHTLSGNPSRALDDGVVPSDSALSVAQAPAGSGAGASTGASRTLGTGASGAHGGGMSISGVVQVSLSGSTSTAGLDTDRQERQQQHVVKMEEGVEGGSLSSYPERSLPAGSYGIVRLWRTVIEVINKLTKLQKAHAMRELAAQHAAALEDLAATVVGRAAAAAGGRAAAAAVAAAVAGGGKAGAAAIGLGVLPAAAEERFIKMLPALAALRTQVTMIKRWQSFSGRDLVCQEEAGLAQEVGSGPLELPGRAIAAIVPTDSLVALVYVSREVYHRAMAMQSEISVRRAVDSCCRLPFLRHTPLKELYRLSRHMQEVTFEPGEVVLHQGRENSCIYFLVRGEVQVVLDLPDTTDALTLSAALAALGGSKLTSAQAQALAAHAAAGTTAPVGVAALSSGVSQQPTTSGETRDGKAHLSHSPGRDTPVPESGSPGSQLPSFGATRRVVLGRRGSGVVLGDDMLREKRLTVGVIAARRCVCLAVSPQRFTMCCDALTLRLFHKLRLQHSATALFTESLLQQEQQAATGNMLREAVLNQSYGPTALKREETPESKTWRAPNVRPEEIGVSADQLYKQRLAQKAAANPGSAASGASHGATSVSATAASIAAASLSFRSTSGGGATTPRIAHGVRSASAGAGGASGVAVGIRTQVSGLTAAAAAAGAGGAAGLAADAPPPKLYGGLTAVLVQEVVGRVAETGSMATFLQRIKAAEAEHATAAAASPYGGGVVVWRDGLPVGPRDLDLSGQLGATTAQPQRTYTDMLEAACMAVIKVELAAGQLDVRLDPLAQVLDDIVVQWSDLAHRFGLQLVRWRTHDYFLVTPLDLSAKGGRRPRVRVMANTLLSMAAEFRRTVAQNEIPHLSMCAGMAIGGLFSSYDGGHFLVHCTGQAYTAAQHLCKIACEQSHWQGTILVADSVAQALSRTHVVQFSTGGSALVGAVGAPPGCPQPSVQQAVAAAAAGGKGGGGAGAGVAVGEEEEEDEPVSPGTRPFFKRGGGGGAAAARDSPLLAMGSFSHSRHFLHCDKEGAALDDGEPPRPEMLSGQPLVSNYRRTLTSSGVRLPLLSASAPLPLVSSTSVSQYEQLQQPKPVGGQRGQRGRGSAAADVTAAEGGGASETTPSTPIRLAPLGGTATPRGDSADGASLPTGTATWTGSGSESRATSPPGAPTAPAAQKQPQPQQRVQHQHQYQPMQVKVAAALGPTPSGHVLLHTFSLHSQLTVPLQPGVLGPRALEGPSGIIGGGGNSVSAGAGSSPQRGSPSLLLEDGVRWRMPTYDSQRPAPVPGGGRLTSNARRRERVAASSSMNLRQQLMQEIGQLRQQQHQQVLQQQQHQLMLHLQQQRQQQGLFGLGQRRSYRRYPGKDGPMGGPRQDPDSAPESCDSPFARSPAWISSKSLSQSVCITLAPVQSPSPTASPARGRSCNGLEQGQEQEQGQGQGSVQLDGQGKPAAAEPQGAGTGGGGGDGGGTDASAAAAAEVAAAEGSSSEGQGQTRQAQSRSSPRSVRMAPPPSPPDDGTTTTGVGGGGGGSGGGGVLSAGDTPLGYATPLDSYRTTSARRLFSSHTAASHMSQASLGLVAAAAAVALAAAADGGSGGSGLQPRPSGVPSRRAPMGYQRPASPYIPFSAVDPSSDAAVVARGGSPPAHTGPPGTVGTVASIPKLVACNYGYLQLPTRSRSRRESAQRQQRDVTSSLTADGELAADRAEGGGGGGLSRSRSVNVSPNSPGGLHFTSHPSSVVPPASYNNSVPLTPMAVAATGADGWGGASWAAGAGQGQSRPARLPAKTNTDAIRSRHGSPPPTAAVAASAVPASMPLPYSTMAVGAGAGGGFSGASPTRRRGPSWQDLGSQRAAEQYAASLPMGLMCVSFSTAGLSRVPPLQRLLYLESLALSYNRLMGLASEQLMGLSQNLKILTLVSADLEELPPDFGALLPGLMELNLCSNRLVTLPPTMGSMTRLRCLSAAHNHLTSLPPSLYSVATLEHLLLPYNRLTAVGEALGRLRRLQTLDLGFNQIACLPSETTSLGGSLTRLTMPYNQLQALPPDFVASMTRLAVLVLDFNPQLASEPQLGGGKTSSKAMSGASATSLAELRLGLGSRPSSRMGGGATTGEEVRAGGASSARGPRAGGGGAGIASGQVSFSGGAVAVDGGQQQQSTAAAAAADAQGRPQENQGQHYGHHSHHPGQGHHHHHGHNGNQGNTNTHTSNPLDGNGADARKHTAAGSTTTATTGSGAADAAAAPPPIAAELSFAQDPPSPGPAGPRHPAPPPASSSSAPPLRAPRGGGAAAGDPGAETNTPFADPSSLSPLGTITPFPSAPVPALALPPTPGAAAPPQPQQQQQMLPALHVLSLSAVQLVQVPSWLPAGLQVLDLSRNNLRRLPAWVCRRLAPSLQVLRLHTNRLESLPQELRQLSQLQLLSLEENPVASPERINTSHGAGWAAEWLYRKKYRSRPEIMASLAHEQTGLTGGGFSAGVSGLGGATSIGTFGAASPESSSLTATTGATAAVGIAAGVIGATSFKAGGAGAGGLNAAGGGVAASGGRSFKKVVTQTGNARRAREEA